MTHQTRKTAKHAPRTQPASVPRTRKTITVKPFAYQPSKAELDAEVGNRGHPGRPRARHPATGDGQDREIAPPGAIVTFVYNPLKLERY